MIVVIVEPAGDNWGALSQSSEYLTVEAPDSGLGSIPQLVDTLPCARSGWYIRRELVTRLPLHV